VSWFSGLVCWGVWFGFCFCIVMGLRYGFDGDFDFWLVCFLVLFFWCVGWFGLVFRLWILYFFFVMFGLFVVVVYWLVCLCLVFNVLCSCFLLLCGFFFFVGWGFLVVVGGSDWCNFCDYCGLCGFGWVLVGV